MIAVEDDAVTTGGVILRSGGPGVAAVVLDRPGRQNALDLPMLRTLPEVLGSLAADPEVRAVVLTGAGAAFSAGGDLSLISRLPELSSDERHETLARAFRATELLHAMPKPTIAAIRGPAVGGGLGLALACDIRLAAPDATFAATFVNMGLVPDFGTTWLLPRVVGAAFALEMTASARRVDADEALAVRLVSRLCDDPLAAAEDLARQIATRSPRAVAATKRMLQESLTLDLAAGLQAEARQQTVELGHEEFLALWSAWRGSVGSGG